MRFHNLLAAAAALVLSSGHSMAAGLSEARIPESMFGLPHKLSGWDPSSVNRVPTVQAKIASLASWYGPGFYGNRTANGEIYTGNDLTAAHKSLPFGTRVRVTNLNNGRSVVVRINDDGPHVGGRVIDLSRAAASRIGLLSSGVAPVRLEVLR
jgi:rare lipoprotein A (peptidoglycan hydrolase)